MQDLIEKMGEPDLKIAGLRIWIDGYAYPNDNWLKALTQCITPRTADVRCRGVYMETRDLAHWLELLLQFDDTGAAQLECIEPNLNIYMKSIDRLGHIELTVEIAPDHMTQHHRFSWEIDQSYLPDIVRSLNAILSRCPVLRMAATDPRA